MLRGAGGLAACLSRSSYGGEGSVLSGLGVTTTALGHRHVIYVLANVNYQFLLVVFYSVCLQCKIPPYH
jgi:hypothetical protein